MIRMLSNSNRVTNILFMYVFIYLFIPKRKRFWFLGHQITCVSE